MSSALESQTHLTSKTTPKKIDNSRLYEEIGNIVIERAHSGDDNCFEIYKRAAKSCLVTRLIKDKEGPARPPSEPETEATTIHNPTRQLGSEYYNE
jgi:hypothetical protein